MASKKHTYIIAINQADFKSSNTYTYDYGKTKDCVISVKANCAFVQYTSTALKTPKEAVLSNIALDAMRRMHLYHIMQYSRALSVKNILVSIDGESTTFTDNEGNDGFPFLRTMLGTKDLKLPNSWKDSDFQKTVLSATKTEAKEDLCFVCLYSYLAATGKRYEIDRFICNWTAMNAHYNHLVALYRDNADLSSLPKKKKKKLNGNNERLFITFLLRVLGCGGIVSSRAKSKNLNVLTYSAGQINPDDLDALYDDLFAHRTDPSYIPANYGRDERGLTPRLNALLPDLHTSAYGCILLDYAYHMRCNFVHGNEAPPLFVKFDEHNGDNELAAFRLLNLFLERYLKENIPLMFSSNWVDTTVYDTITNFFNSAEYDDAF